MEWISVEDRLPDYDVYVLWINEGGNQFVADIDHDCDWESFKEIHESIGWMKPYHKIKITHWMPLPEPPKKQ